MINTKSMVNGIFFQNWPTFCPNWNSNHEWALIKVLLKRYSVLLHHPAQKAMIFCTFLIQYAHPPDKQKTDKQKVVLKKTKQQKLINFQLLVISLSQKRCIHKVSDVLVSHQEKKNRIPVSVQNGTGCADPPDLGGQTRSKSSNKTGSNPR